ncbi:bacterioferritin-associated ferredoxin [Sinobacterium caligoides]|nr:bacterioferritin-associated ferredoxin [Sinobacterium caligoides]
MYICLCKGITDNQIRDAVEDGVNNVRELRDLLGIASQCGKCGKEAKRVINESLHCARSNTAFYPA